MTEVATVANKACTAGNILNCKTFASAANTCDVCADNYYRASSTSCLIGAISGCLKYTSQNVC